MNEYVDDLKFLLMKINIKDLFYEDSQTINKSC